MYEQLCSGLCWISFSRRSLRSPEVFVCRLYFAQSIHPEENSTAEYLLSLFREKLHGSKLHSISADRRKAVTDCRCFVNRYKAAKERAREMGMDITPELLKARENLRYMAGTRNDIIVKGARFGKTAEMMEVDNRPRTRCHVLLMLWRVWRV